jgi:hypothetical protein
VKVKWLPLHRSGRAAVSTLSAIVSALLIVARSQPFVEMLLFAFSIGGAVGPLLSSLCVLALGAGGLYTFALVVTLALSWLSQTRR